MDNRPGAIYTPNHFIPLIKEDTLDPFEDDIPIDLVNKMELDATKEDKTTQEEEMQESVEQGSRVDAKKEQICEKNDSDGIFMKTEKENMDKQYRNNSDVSLQILK